MDLDLLSWNYRGICGDDTTRALKDLIAQNRPHMVFLCETKISVDHDFRHLQSALRFSRVEMVLSNGRSSGLGLFWSEDVQVQTISKSAHHIDVEIVNGQGIASWWLTGFYDYAATGDREKSWQLLRELADSSLSWLVIGDFNEILNSSEKIDGAPRPERQMRGFRDVLGYGDLLDLGYHGVMATWGNSETLLRQYRAVFNNSKIEDQETKKRLFKKKHSKNNYVMGDPSREPSNRGDALKTNGVGDMETGSLVGQEVQPLSAILD